MKDGSSLVQLCKSVSAATGVTLRNSLFAFQEDFYHWGLRFLSKRRADAAPLVFKRREIFEADALDIKLVKASRNTTSSSYRALAQRLGVPLSTINSRFARLIKGGVISEDRFFVVQSGPDIQQAQFLPSFASRSAELEKKLLDFCQDVPHVTALVSCAGNWDYRIVVYAANPHQIFSVHDTFKRKFANVLVDCPLSMRRYRYPTSETGL
jgi:DNA-binding Lrp family transcriptional regulator